MASLDDIAAWRQRIFSSLLSFVLGAGTLAAIPMVAMLVHRGLWPMAAMDILALAWMFAIWRLERLPYTLRVLNFLGIVYALAVALMLVIGPVSLNYLLGPPVIAALLLGIRQGVLALVLGVITIVGFGATGHIDLGANAWQDGALKASLAVAVNYLCVGAVLTLTCGTLIKGLSHTLADAHSFAASLETSQAVLRDLNAELQLTSAAVASLNDMVLITQAVDGQDGAQPVIFVNDAFLRRTGYAREQIIGHDLRMLEGPDTDPAAVARLLEAIATHRPFSTELVSYTRAGIAFWVEVDIVPFVGESERASHCVVVARDITERRSAADAIHRLAFYDVLTGLPNRRMLMDRLDTLVAQARARQGLGAVLYLDLDNFKNVNDARGHGTGDLLLRHAAARLGHAVRKRDTVARIGGDEFVVLLDGLGLDPFDATREALAVADKLRATLAQPMRIDGQTYQTSASVGVALPVHAGVSAHDLLREADTAMYHAKADGRNGVSLFEASMLAGAERKLTLERDLGQALENGEMEMHLQLQVDHEGMPSGAELLMRWRRPDRRTVPPEVFIPIAESSGLIVTLGRWVLREACQAWLRLERAGRPLPLSINVSPMQFRQPDFVDEVRALLLETGVPADQLIFEVTEGLLIEDVGQAIERMQALTDIGIRFSIDDFGTGYSNLAYLKKMPLYELKIDKSFMRDTPHDSNGTAIVQSILAMAQHLGLRVVAEGIESAEQAGFLAAHGRPHMQGYLFHRPMPLEQLIEWLLGAGAPQASAAS